MRKFHSHNMSRQVALNLLPIPIENMHQLLLSQNVCRVNQNHLRFWFYRRKWSNRPMRIAPYLHLIFFFCTTDIKSLYNNDMKDVLT